MANKYTGEAYAGVQPVQEDFGATGMNALQIDMTLRANDLAERQAQTKAARDAQKNLEANMKRFDELATAALDFTPQAFDSQSLSLLVAGTKEQIADMRRELADPTTSISRQSEIYVQVGDMKNKAANYTKGMHNFQKFIESLSKTGKGGIDPIMNSDIILAINEAMQSAGKHGLQPKGDGTYSMGEYVDTYYQNGMLNYTIRGKDGKVLATGSPDEITSKLSAQLKPFIDMDEMFQSAGKMVGDATIRSFKLNDDGTILNVEQTNMSSIAEKAGDLFDMRYGNTYETDPYMQKGAAEGRWNNKDEAKKAFIKSALINAKDTFKQYLQKNPTINFGGYGDQRKMDAINNALDNIHKAMNGDVAAKQLFIGNKSVSFINAGDVNRRAQLADITTNGDVTTFHFLGEVKKNRYSRPDEVGYTDPFTMSFNANDPEDQKIMSSILKDYWNGAAQSPEKLLDSDLLNFNFGSRMYVPEENEPQVSSTLNEIMSISDKLLDKNSDESVEELKGDLKRILDNANISGVFPFEISTSGSSGIVYDNRKLNLIDKETGEKIETITFTDDPKKIAESIRGLSKRLAELSTSKGKPRRIDPRFINRSGNRNNASASGRTNPLPFLD